MLRWLRHTSELQRTGQQIYERIVAQARSEGLYLQHGVADSMEGRFEMILLHLVLVRERLKHEGAAGQRLGQDLLERLISDMDDALRQIGIGDMGVPRRVKRAAAAFGERAQAYVPALAPLPPADRRRDAPDDRLETALLTHVYQCRDAGETAAHIAHVDALAAYVRRAAAALSAMPSAELLAGTLDFGTLGGTAPDPRP